MIWHPAVYRSVDEPFFALLHLRDHSSEATRLSVSTLASVHRKIERNTGMWKGYHWTRCEKGLKFVEGCQS